VGGLEKEHNFGTSLLGFVAYPCGNNRSLKMLIQWPETVVAEFGFAGED
jgi:hypothetical protein